MSCVQILKDVTTGKDGESFDIARVVMTANTLVLIPVLVVGVSLFVYGWYVGKPFPLNDFFDSILKFEEGVGALLVTGSMSIFFKRQTEPDGSLTEETVFTKGKQPDNVTVVTPP